MISYGGGVQSTAMIVLAVQGKIIADVALFANVGDDSEHPATLRYVREVAQPWAAGHGFEVHELRKLRRDGSVDVSLLERLKRPGSRSLPIPVRMADTGAPGTRNCTQTYKLAVIERWLREHRTDHPVDVAVGISVDEWQRASSGRDSRVAHRVYPLLDLGISRDQCRRIIHDAGLAVPPKSACYFCPFHRPQTWREMRRDEPELFDRAQALEDLLNVRRDALGKDHVYLTRFGRRLSDAVAEAQPTLFAVDEDYGSDIGETGCDEGVCFV